MTIQSVDFVALLPALIVAGGALLVLVADLFLARGPIVPGVLAVLVSLGGLAVLPGTSGRETLCIGEYCTYSVREITLSFQGITLVATATVALVSIVVVKDLAIPAGEHFFLILCSATGALVVPATTDFVSLVIALELVSLPTFALIGLHSGDRRAGEAALKAFLFSVTSVAVSLYGIALLYGSIGAEVQGTMSYRAIFVATSQVDPTPVAVAGLVLLLAVIGFKISAIPFQAWAPDSYEGAPIPVAAYLSVVSKVAGFGALVFVAVSFQPWSQVWTPVVALAAAVTMVVANAAALRQRGAVRLLAWSSIAQAGYVMVPLAAFASGANVGPNLIAVVGYLAAYTAMNLGAFAVVAVVARDRPRARIADFTGLAWRSPWLGISLAFFLACLAGLPPGVIGLLVKVQVIAVPIASGAWWLAAAMAVGTVIGLYYYLSWAALLFQRPVRGEIEGLTRPGGGAIKIAVAAMLAVTVTISVVPTLAMGLLENV